jgi:nucleoside-diphosphate-sugar epimerase
MARIHVTGGEGFLGRYIVPELERGHGIVASERPGVDVTDLDSLLAAFEADRPDVVVHLAALCGAQPSVENPQEFYRVNAWGTVQTLKACRRLGIERFVFASSMTVFGSSDGAPVTESSSFAPRHPYAAAKVSAEAAVAIYARVYGLAAIVLRPTLVVGEGYKEPHAVGDFVARALRGEAIELYGGGRHVRDFAHPEDVARAFSLAVDRVLTLPRGTHETFNISNGEPISMADLADLVVRLAGRGEKRVVSPTAQTFSLYTSIDEAKRTLGFAPRVTLAAIIERLVAQTAARSQEKP